MLEYGFNELDNDFVTLWSRWIVSGGDSLIFKDLTKLAELGQINAVQSWYLLAKDNDYNSVIDNFVSNLGNSGANELLAIAHRAFFASDRLIYQIPEWRKLKSKIGFFTMFDNEYMSYLYDLTYEIQESEFVNAYRLAIKAYYNNYKRTFNPLFLERLYEIMAGMTKLDKKLFLIDIYTSSIEFKRLRKTLLEMYKQNKNNVEIAFTLGKNLILFESNDKLKKLGSQILTELSKRELSATLQNYEIKGTEHLIKELDDSKELSAQDKYEIDITNNVEKIMKLRGIDCFSMDASEYKKVLKESEDINEM